VKLSWQVILQAIATASQVFNAYGAFVPAKYQALIAGVLGGLQVLIGTIAHFYNTDGTPQGTPLPASAPTTAVTASPVKPPAGGPDT
jgi:hypothetical protein